MMIKKEDVDDADNDNDTFNDYYNSYHNNEDDDDADNDDTKIVLLVTCDDNDYYDTKCYTRIVNESHAKFLINDCIKELISWNYSLKRQPIKQASLIISFIL